MFTLDFMRNEIVHPSINRFIEEPNSISLAVCAIMAVDAYASHAALSAFGGTLEKHKLQNAEIEFKNALCANEGASSWKFQVVRETSNALKHGLRQQSNLVPNSAMVVRNVERTGMVWYFARDSLWGTQVVVKLNLTRDDTDPCWMFQGKPFGSRGNPLFPEVPVYDILAPSVELVDSVLEA
ncbi:MAG: hypothetical protein JJU19_08285 [Pararhodobacter sp.]|nr:hypothetical protein [Pararhodobacter sp.]